MLGLNNSMQFLHINKINLIKLGKKMNLDELTLGQLKEIQALGSTPGDTRHPYDVGRNCLIRTVTHIYTGKLVGVYEQELELLDAAWIADTGRFSDSLKDFSNFDEVEPFPSGKCVIGRGALCDYHPTNEDLPRSQK